MRLVIQRVSEAAVNIHGKITGQIGPGLMLLLGIEEEDNEQDIEYLVNKVVNLRIFSDAAGLMNLSIQDIQGSFLVVSQFTLYASTKKGNRPSFLRASKPPIAIPLYENFLNRLQIISHLNIETGIFGADMKVSLINDGPVTIIMDSKKEV